MRTELLERAVAEINKQHPDLITFTGDIQNMRPQELTRFAPVLARLKAKDGVYSVLGNHDYSQYMPKLDEAHKRANERLTRRFQTSIGWNLLLNDNRIIRRTSAISAESRFGQDVAWCFGTIVCRDASARPFGMAPFNTA